MPEEVTEVVQEKPVEVKTEVKADQPTDGGEGGAEPKPELPAEGEPTGDKATPEPGEKPAEEPEVKTEAKGLEKRFAELTRKQREAERKAELAEARAQQATDALLRLGKPEPEKKTPVEEDPKPEVPVFEDPTTFAQDMAGYTERLTMWAARQAVKADRMESEKRRSQETHVQLESRIKQEHAERVKKARETFSDYSEIAEDPDLPITQAMGYAIMKSEEGPAVNYYLGQHRDEAARIAKLPPDEQLIEFGAIKAQLLAARKTPTTRLPTPIKPQTGTSGVGKSVDDLDMDAYAAKAKSEGRVRI